MKWKRIVKKKEEDKVKILVRIHYHLEEDREFYNLRTTSSNKKILLDTTPKSSPPTTTNSSSRSVATRRKKINRGGGFSFGCVLQFRCSEQQDK